MGSVRHTSPAEPGTKREPLDPRQGAQGIGWLRAALGSARRVQECWGALCVHDSREGRHRRARDALGCSWRDSEIWRGSSYVRLQGRTASASGEGSPQRCVGVKQQRPQRRGVLLVLVGCASLAQNVCGRTVDLPRAAVSSTASLPFVAEALYCLLEFASSKAKVVEEK